jgi:hypothetical protein
VLCQGPYYIVQDGEPFKRTLNFRFGGGVYFPLDSDPTWSFGKNARGARRRRSAAGAGVWKYYVEQKHRRCESLCNVQTITRRLGA